MAIVFGPTQWQYCAYQSILVQEASLGDSVGGGYLTCRNGGVAWIVAPSSTEVSRTWCCRNDAVTTATNCTTVTGWFVLTRSQLENQGSGCKTYWDSYSSNCYWSSTENSGSTAWGVNFANGETRLGNKIYSLCVRAFRCVAY